MYICHTIRFLTCDRIAHFKTGWQVLKQEARVSSYNTVVLHSRDRYEIIGLRKSSHYIKQPCSSIYLKKAFAMHQSC